jgi:hypothetical protein
VGEGSLMTPVTFKRIAKLTDVYIYIYMAPGLLSMSADASQKEKL